MLKIRPLAITAWSGVSFIFAIFLVALIALLQPLYGVWLNAIGDFLRYPGSLASLGISVYIAICAQLGALWLALLFLRNISVRNRPIPRLWALFLAMPHAAFAISFVFLFSPSGWFLRLISPWLSGLSRPPDYIFINDPNGISMILVLMLKETPFLFFVGLAALTQLPTATIYQQGASLGYERSASWRYLVLPQLLKMLTLPMLAVLVYSLSVVDIALIVGPQRPVPFSILMHQWFFDPTREFLLNAHISALSLLITSLLLIALWILFIHLCARWLIKQPKKRSIRSLFSSNTYNAAFALLLLIYLSSVIILFIYSISKGWRFPHNFPQSFNFEGWYAMNPTKSIVDSIITATISALISIILAIILLEYQIRRARFWPDWLICFSLLVPQITLLLGLYTAGLNVGLNAGWILVILGHITFIFPYTYIALKEPYRHFNQFQYLAAISLGAHPIKSWFKVKLPSLKISILSALAIALASSILQYLPTQILGAGRVESVTVRAVTAANGFDRGDAARWALIQLILGAIGFTIAMYMNRKARSHRIEGN